MVSYPLWYHITYHLWWECTSEPISPAYLSSRHQAAIVVGYGLDQFNKIFTERMLLSMLSLIHWTRQVPSAMASAGYDSTAIEAINAYLALVIDRIADYGSSITSWHLTGEKITHTFAGFRLPMAWDFTELNPTVKTSGGYPGQLEWVARFIEHALEAAGDQAPKVRHGSAVDLADHSSYDAIITDPPYYDAVPYAVM